MINFYVTYKAKDDETRKAFYKEIKENEIITKTLAEDGCIRYDYYYPAESDTDILLWEQWESREHQKKHTAQTHFKTIGKIKEKYSIQSEVIIEEVK